MKNVIILATFLLFIFSCSKEEFTPIYEAGPMPYGWVEASKNGKDFIAAAAGTPHENAPSEFWGLQFCTKTSQGFMRESFTFNEIIYEKGTFEMSGKPSLLGDGLVGAFYATLIDDGDVLGDVYELNESKDNWITISEIDTVANFVKGTFQASFVIRLDADGKKDDPNNPSKVEFKNGEFEVMFNK